MKPLLLVLFFLLFFTFSAQKALGQENVIETDVLVGEEKIATQSTTTSGRVNYELPHPGMLPDNPFYFFKAVRDGIVKLLINDDLKRSRFNLLNAEKRMFAGRLLIEKGNDPLAVETISKSNNYLHDAIESIEKYADSHPNSMDVKPFILQIDTAVAKHDEIMDDLKKQINEEARQSFDAEHKRLSGIKKSVKNLTLQY